MYKSPVELFVSDIKLQVDEKLEEACYTAVMEYFPNVDREELLKALKYDRQQYEQGYRDAVAEKNLVEVVRCPDCVHCERCTNWRGREYLGCSWFPYEVHEVGADYFCGHGERRPE